MANKTTSKQARYDGKNTVQIHLKLNKNTDEDIIAKLATVAKQTYIKELIRKDLRNGVHNQPEESQ